MEKIRILTVGCDSSVKGGITSVINQFKNYQWINSAIEMDYLVTYKTTNFFGKIFTFIKGYLKLIRMLKRKHYDIVHIHMAYGASYERKRLIADYCLKHNVKVIVHLHGSCFKDWYDELNSKKQKQIKSFLEKLTTLIVLGDKWEKIIKNIQPKTKTFVINNSVSLPNYCVHFEKPFNFLFLGVLIKRKGVEDLIKAVNLIDAEIKKNILIIIGGTGEEEPYLKKIIKILQLENNFVFEGWVSGEKKEQLLKKCQAFVLPSYNEGLPIGILEAMSYGMPIISTSVGDISSAVRNGENGYLINPGDIAALAKAMTDIFNNKRFVAMSKKSRDICIEKFSDTLFFENVIKLYRNIVFENKE